MTPESAAFVTLMVGLTRSAVVVCVTKVPLDGPAEINE